MEKKLPVHEIIIIIGIDGIGKFYEQAQIPTLDNFFKEGIYWKNAKAVKPTDSAENWGSFLHGVFPKKHKLTNGIVESGKKYDENSPYPSIFKIIFSHLDEIKIAKKDDLDKIEMASYVSWEPINSGIIEKSVEMKRYSPLINEWFFWKWWMILKHKWLKKAVYDYFTVFRLIEYIEKLDNKGKKIIFVHLTDTDEQGHLYGFGLDEHLKQIEITDNYLKTIFEAIDKKKEKEWKDKKILILITTDHGGINHKDGRGTHGGKSEDEVNVFLTVKGDKIDKIELKDKEYNMNGATIVLEALEIKIPENFDAKLPTYFNYKNN